MSEDGTTPVDGSRRSLSRLARLGLALALVAGLAVAAYFVITHIRHIRGTSDGGSPSSQTATLAPAVVVPPPALVKTSVGVYLKSLTTKKYGWIAHTVGKRDCTEDRTVFAPNRNWWETPSVLYQDPVIAEPDVAAEAACGEFKGYGKSRNVEVHTTVTGWATLALKTAPRSDCMKGTIAVTLNGSSQYYDDDWTPLFEVKDWTLVFEFDTRDPARPVKVAGTERRTFEVSVECYRREAQRWSPKGEWPETRERADTRTVFYAKDAILDVTAYRYDDPPAATK